MKVDITEADSVNLLIFGTAESAVTIIAVSIPILRALLHITPPKPRLFQHLYDETPRDGNQAPRDFGSAVELVTLERHETGHSEQGLDLTLVDPREHTSRNQSSP